MQRIANPSSPVRLWVAPPNVLYGLHPASGGIFFGLVLTPHEFLNQVSRTGCLVFAHQVDTMNLHGSVADAQRFADRLAAQALRQMGGHLALAGREFGFHRFSR